MVADISDKRPDKAECDIRPNARDIDFERVDSCMSNAKDPASLQSDERKEDIITKKRKKPEKNMFCDHCQEFVTKRTFKSHQENQRIQDMHEKKLISLLVLIC